MPQESQRRKTPYEKKQDEYDKDRFAHAEYPHLFRRAKPRKKKGVNRNERRKVREIIHRAVEVGAEESVSVPLIETVAKPIRRFPYKGATPLRQIVEWKLSRRTAMHGARKRRHGQPYVPLPEGKES